MLCTVSHVFLYVTRNGTRLRDAIDVCCLFGEFAYIRTATKIFRIALRNAAARGKEAEERWVHDPYVFAPKWCPSSEITSRMCTYMCGCTRAQEIRARRW